MFLKKSLTAYFLIQLLFFIPVSIVSMEPGTEAIDTVEQLAPFSYATIDFMPKYVYENPNQYKKYNWSDDTFKKLKTAVIKITEQSIKKQLSFSPNATLEEQLKNKEKYEQTAESYDWIYALGFIEKNLLKRPVSELTINDLIEINARISRFVFEGNSKGFREISAFWPLENATLAGDLILDYFNENHDSIINGADKFVKIIVKDEKEYLAVQDLVNVLRHISGGAAHVTDPRGRILDFSEPKRWAESEDNSNLLEIQKFYDISSISFVEPWNISVELEKLIKYIKNSEDIKPLERAINVWYEIIRIHPFNQAHKRTAKAVASIILLQNGYLPPLITQRDEKEYTSVLIDDLKANKGPVKFTKFIFRLINETQESFKGKDLN